MGLRDTLVCDDLDTAVKVAYEGNKCVWRVVTLDGGLIDITGTMSGGGTSVKKGGMKTGSREGANHTELNQFNDESSRVTATQRVV
jgi:structural maintenance of chromosome 4